jgi:hypothetical protein
MGPDRGPETVSNHQHDGVAEVGHDPRAFESEIPTGFGISSLPHTSGRERLGRIGICGLYVSDPRDCKRVVWTRRDFLLAAAPGELP